MTPELTLSSELTGALDQLATELGSLEQAETVALQGALEARVTVLPGWNELGDEARRRWRDEGHFVLRGFRSADPIALLATTLLVGRAFRSYRRDKIVKQFTMSPWTRALSHTTDEGHFHSDLNTAATPPAVTAIQCVQPDPSAPTAGELRVVTVASLVAALERRGDTRALSFLKDDKLTMVSDAEPGAGWCGRLIDQGEIRFHPETLRAAARRVGGAPSDLEAVLGTIKVAALETAPPIQLDVGDALFVANRRALHYRGACTVRFRSFPRDFESRSVHVLHLMNEAA